MPRLSSELYRRCRNTLLKCGEFDIDASLRAVFVTDELYPFRDRLPAATSKTDRVDKCLGYLLEQHLSDGRPVLPLFLVALRDRYQEGDALRDELGKLVEDIGSALLPPVTPSPEQRPKSAPSVLLPTMPSPEPQTQDDIDTGLVTTRPVSLSPWLILVSVIAALILGLVSNALANMWQVDTPQRFLITIGVFFLALAMVLWAEFRRLSIPAAGGSLFVMRASVGIGALCLAVGIVWSITATLSPLLKPSTAPIPVPTFTPTLSYPPSPPASPVAIVSPSEGKEVSVRTRVRGTALNVPGDQQLWVLVQKGEGGGFYPQPGPIEVDAQGAWEVVARIGTNSELEWHKPFTISVAMADVDASQRFSEFLGHWPENGDKGLALPEGAVVLDSVGVTRKNPIVTFSSHTPKANAGSHETLKGTYLNLEPGNWHLYGIVEVEDARFVPYGPFEPEVSEGEWAIDVEFPWPADGTREISFHTLAVLSDTRSDGILQSSVGSLLSTADLANDARDNIYGPLTQIRLTRAERIAFASDKPGNDDIFIINSDGSGLMRLTDDPAEDSDPAWSPDGSHIVFASAREGSKQLFVMDADGQNVNRVITDTVMHAQAPSWSPNGEWIAFHSWHEGNLDIFKVRADGTDLTQLTEDPERDFYPVWSPDGQRILFLSDHATDDADHSELYVMDADGGNVTRLTHNEASEEYAVWLPDGQYILFTSDLGGGHDVYLMNADGSNVKRGADVDYDRHPTLAPDGRRFVFDSSVNNRQLFLATLEGGKPTRIQTGLARSCLPAWSPVKGDERIAFVGRFDGDWEIYTMWDDGTDLLRLMDTDANEVQPRISPDGRQVAFASDIEGNYEIWLEDARTPAPWIRLTNNTANDWQPAWSPDGRKLAFASDRDGNWDIYVMNANGTGVVQLTNDPAEDSFPTWTPDGRRITFYSRRSGDGDIYVMEAADGGNVTLLVANPGYDWCPAWSPDGRTLVFASARDFGGTYATELYALDLLSGNPSRLTNNNGYDAIPLWSGDGRHIYFTSDQYWGIDDIWVMDADGSNARNLTQDDRSDIFGGP